MLRTGVVLALPLLLVGCARAPVVSEAAPASQQPSGASFTAYQRPDSPITESEPSPEDEERLRKEGIRKECADRFQSGRNLTEAEAPDTLRSFCNGVFVEAEREELEKSIWWRLWQSCCPGPFMPEHKP